MVAPAPTSGWYPNPSLDATETIIPPTGTDALWTSFGCEVPAPVNVIDEIPEVKEKENALDLKVNNGKIDFSNVQFSYSNEESQILNSINLKPFETIWLSNK